MSSNNASISEISVDQLRSFMDSHNERDYMLVDVREPEEYKTEHIPGAKLIPLMSLENGAAEVNPAQHTFFYCRSGKRSMRGAQAFAKRNKTSHIYNVSGGITAWQGKTLPDFPKLQVFEDIEDPEQLLHRAIDMEKGAERLYLAMLRQFSGTQVELLVQRLADAEESHARVLYGKLKEIAMNPLAPFESYYRDLPGLVLESGEPLANMVTWLSNNSVDYYSILEVALELELKAYDLYRNLAHNAKDKKLETTFLNLASQEQNHVNIVLRGFAQLAEARA
jgi:rhodanese-related sulfurtransferase/rubrerythrin